MVEKKGEIRGYKVLSGSALKWIAVFSMVSDHFAVVVLRGIARGMQPGLSGERYVRWNRAYVWMGRIGRTAFPLFAFLLVEGFFHSRDRKKYGLRLFVFALLSEIPFDLAFLGRFSWQKQNVLFSLFLGLVLMVCAEKVAKGGRLPGRLVLPAQLLIMAAGAGLAYVCKLDYTYKGIALVAVFYFFYPYLNSAAVAGYCVFAWNLWSFPAFALLPFYNGRRGRGGGKWFYLFYPLHLLILYGVLRAALCLGG